MDAILVKLKSRWHPDRWQIGIQNGTDTLEQSWPVSSKVKYTFITQSNNSTLRYLPKRNEDIVTQNLSMNVHSIFVYNSRKLEIAPVSISWWGGKQILCTHSVEYYSAIKRNELLAKYKSIMLHELR